MEYLSGVNCGERIFLHLVYTLDAHYTMGQLTLTDSRVTLTLIDIPAIVSVNSVLINNN